MAPPLTSSLSNSLNGSQCVNRPHLGSPLESVLTMVSDSKKGERSDVKKWMWSVVGVEVGPGSGSYTSSPTVSSVLCFPSCSKIRGEQVPQHTGILLSEGRRGGKGVVSSLLDLSDQGVRLSRCPFPRNTHQEYSGHLTTGLFPGDPPPSSLLSSIHRWTGSRE